MRSFIPPELTTAFPEMFLVFVTLLLLLMGVARNKEDYGIISNFSVFTLAAVALVICRFSQETMVGFNGMYITDAFGSYMKFLVVVGSAAAILMATGYAERQRIARYEYPVLVLFSTLGMMLMISANDLISLYMAIELQSLPLYVMAAIQRDTLRSTEAGVKYFVLGALSSGLLLYGASLIYGYTGTTNFDLIAVAFSGQGEIAIGAVVGMVMLACGLAFKIGAVPFHMWTPDVYEGAPTSVTAFFSIAPKIAALALMVRVFKGPFAPLEADWQQVIVVLSAASMLLGAVAAIAQTNIKRMLAYSSIGHMGYALIGLAAANVAGVAAVMVYAGIYMAANIGVFAIVLMMKRKERMVESIHDLAGLAGKHPVLAMVMAALMFSLAGIPPLAGFFGKLFIFQAAIDAKLYKLAIIGVLSSVIAAFYYLRIIKIMYFDPAIDDGLDPAIDRRLNYAMSASFIVVILFIVVPGPLLTYSEAAASVFR